MEKKTVTVVVDEKVRNAVEACDYEYATRRDAVTFMLANNMDINTEAFKSYQEEMKKFNVMFSKAKSEIERVYVLPVTEGKPASWSLDYETAILTITFKD